MPADELDVAELYSAIQKYIEGRGGSVIVIGGISIMQWPEDGPHKYMIGIRITGRMPSAEHPTHIASPYTK